LTDEYIQNAQVGQGRKYNKTAEAGVSSYNPNASLFKLKPIQDLIK
jgi:hypothetical protein